MSSFKSFVVLSLLGCVALTGCPASEAGPEKTSATTSVKAPSSNSAGNMALASNALQRSGLPAPDFPYQLMYLADDPLFYVGSKRAGQPGADRGLSSLVSSLF